MQNHASTVGFPFQARQCGSYCSFTAGDFWVQQFKVPLYVAFACSRQCKMNAYESHSAKCFNLLSRLEK